MHPTESIPESLRSARVARGLSQRELGKRVGLPQSHISKIEAGRTDLKLSSLVELTRALGLEMKLVPRSALTAVDSLISGANPEPDPEATRRALDRIRRGQQAASRLAGIESIKPDLIRIQQNLAALQNHRFNRPDLAALSKALEPLDLVRKRFAQLDLPAERLGNLVGGFVTPLDTSARSLDALREHFAASRAAASVKPRPAHSLDDDGDE